MVSHPKKVVWNRGQRLRHVSEHNMPTYRARGQLESTSPCPDESKLYWIDPAKESLTDEMMSFIYSLRGTCTSVAIRLLE